jgi:hypothetical protein
MQSPRSPEKIWDEIGSIVENYPLLACDQCAIAVLQWLKIHEIEGKVLKLRTKRRTDLYIISDRIPAQESITENGIHYGVEVMVKVFDNLSREGLLRAEWIQDFHCRSGQFIIEELDTL